MFKGKGKSVATYASVEDTAPFADHDKAEDDGMVDEETLSSSSPPSSRKGGDGEEADEDEYILVDPTKQQTATATSCTFNLVNNIIGGGVLALPFALKTSGIFLGSFLLCLVGALSAYSCQLLISASSHVETKSYRAIAAACYGRKGAIMLDLSMVLFIFGALTGYMIIVGDVLTPFTGFLGPLDTRAFVVAVAMLTVMLPLSLLTKVDKLKYTSILALACILYLVGVVSFHGVKHVWDKSVKESLEDLHLMRFTVGVFTSIPIICFSFTFHPNIFPIFGEMKNATRRRMQRVVFSSSAFCGIVYVVVGVLGYITFAEETEGNIFTNYNDNTAVEVGKILLAVIICVSYPLLHYAARLHLDELLVEIFGEARLPDIRWRYIVITILYALLSYGLSILVPDIAIVFSLVGATAGNIIVFIAPGMMYVRLMPGRLRSPKKIGALTLAVLGALFGVISVVVTIVEDVAGKL